MEPKENIDVDTVREVRENYMSVNGIAKSRYLLGHCHENAFNLCERLRKRGFDADIVLGAFETERMDGPPDTPEKASSLGCIHFWVVVGDTHVDMATEPDASIHVGDIPENYIKFHVVEAESADDLLCSNLGY